MAIVAQIFPRKIRPFRATPLLRVGDEKPLRGRVAIRALIGQVLTQVSSHGSVGVVKPAQVTEILAGGLGTVEVNALRRHVLIGLRDDAGGLLIMCFGIRSTP